MEKKATEAIATVKDVSTKSPSGEFEIVMSTDSVDRDGEIIEVHGEDGGPPYVVEWSDGRTGLIHPGPGSVLKCGHTEDAQT